MRNLNDFLPPQSGWNLEAAADINDAGQICGYGRRPSYDNLGFLLTPVHPAITITQPSPGQAGRNNTITASGCTQGATVRFYYSATGGGTIIPGCDLQDAALQIDTPRLAGSAVANANGVATLIAFVPNAARNAGDILIQAVEVSNCKQSQLIVTRFQ